jgi:CRISPR system Cascade subunit CasB
VRTLTGRNIAQLQAKALNGDTAAKGALAGLRRLNPEDLATNHAFWEIAGGLDPEATGGEPTAKERAAVLAAHLYAHHQQSHATGMHRWDREEKRGPGFGDAMRRLAVIRRNSPQGVQSLERRLHAALESASQVELVMHLRPLVQQLSIEGIPLDYGQLAADLYTANYEDGRRTLQTIWGRQYRNTRNTSDTEGDK